MCAVCGLPSTHTTLLTTLATGSVVSFVVLTFATAWLTLRTERIRRWLRHVVVQPHTPRE